MLNKILFLTKGQINTSYLVTSIEEECDIEDTLVVVDNKPLADKFVQKGYAVLYASLTDEFVTGIKYITTSTEDCDDSYFEMVFARQKGIPLVILETSRTIVREMTVEDLPQLYELYDDELIKQYVDDLYEYEEEKAFTEKYIENMYAFYGYGLWLVFDKKNSKLIGRIGISIRNIDGEDQNELGYIIGREYRNQGYAKEVCSEVVKYAGEELGIKELYIVSHNDNYMSEGLARALGFELIGETLGEKDKYKIFVKST